MSFLDIVSKFNQQADRHSKSQSLNPFSEQFEQSRSPSPRFSREDYGKPVAGSKTDLRGRKAKSHICREILELCTVIHDVGTYNAKKRNDDDDDDDNEDDGTIIVSFGELFQIYTKISDKVVGLLIAAKRRGFVYFDREILFQRRDDDVLIALLKPISEISKILKDDISQANAPAASIESKPTEKKKSTSSNKTKRAKPECNNEQSQQIDNCTTTVDQTNVILEVNGDAVVEAENNRGHDREIKHDQEINNGGAVEEISIDGKEDDGDGINRTDRVNGEEVSVEIEIDNGKTGGDDETRSSEVDGGVVMEIQINGEGNEDDEIKGNDEVTGTVVEIKIDGEGSADDKVKGNDEIVGTVVDIQFNGEGNADDEIKSNDGAAGTVVEVEVMNNSSEVSESIEVESIQVTAENVDSDKNVIDEEIKMVDVNDSNKVTADKNENVDSADGQEAREKIENIKSDKYVNSEDVDIINESIEMSSCNGVGNINGEIEHIIITFSEN